MKPRQTILDQFSMFLLFADDRVVGWAIDARLQRNMQTQMAKQHQLSSEAYWATYWHRQWLDRDQGHNTCDTVLLAQSHLSAYLQEPCYWATQMVVRRIAQHTNIIGDCFQAAIEKVPKVLRACDPNHRVSLKTYSQVAFENIIRDMLRRQHQLNCCNDWALLLKVSRKQVKEALQQAGLALTTVESYLHAQQCYEEEYWLLKSGVRQRIERPKAEEWHSLVQLYNQRHSQHPPIKAATLEAWLLDCAKYVRAYLYPKVMSLSAPRGEQSSSWHENLSAPQAEPMAHLMQQEEQTLRQTQRSQVNDLLSTTLSQLNPSTQQLLNLYYHQKLTQQDIAQQLDVQQYTVSRRLSKAREQLLLALMQWSQTTLHIEPTSIVIKHISTLLEEWLQSHGATPCLPSITPATP